MEQISGTIVHIIYTNPTNRYTVLDIDVSGTLISATGIVISAAEGERITANGEWYTHPNYGEQFRINDIVIDVPDDLESIRNYLSSGLLSGIGEKKADDLISYFGLSVLDVISENPYRLTEVKGIGEKTARNIHEAYEQQFAERNAIMALSKYGITVHAALRLYDKYGGNAVKLIEKNPYKLIGDFSGIGFIKADTIAKNVGIEYDSPTRIAAGLRYCMTLSIQRGYTYLPEEILIRETSKLLGLQDEQVEDEILSTASSGRIVLDDTYGQRRCYLPFLYECEVSVAEKIKEMADNPSTDPMSDCEKLVEDYERYMSVTLDEIQKKAVQCAVNNKITLITGGPGTGKTTIIKAIIHILSLKGKQFALAAPTGRASKRMSEACGCESKTIHRLLEYGYNIYGDGADSLDEQSMLFQRNADNPLEYDTVIIDEMSMVDLPLAYHLLDALPTDTSLILVGDADQLPSVGPGNILSDLIGSGILTVVKLKTVFRQAQESLIITNAHRINRGELPIIPDNQEEFLLLEAITQQKIAAKMMELLRTDRYGVQTMMKADQIQMIAPFRNGDAGVNQMNIQIQNYLNPQAPNKEEFSTHGGTLREGDKVMQTKNNYSIAWKHSVTHASGEGIYNGDMGYIHRIDKKARQITVLFEKEKLVAYTFAEAESLSLAYAVTIHKSQGSEFEAVLIPICSGNREFLTRNLIYTAVTRAKKKVILVGEKYVLQNMIKNERTQRRFSALGERLSGK
ncbi:MAG: ATP-dependent RecD-like DNA helicase [Anaerofustis sp.]